MGLAVFRLMATVVSAAILIPGVLAGDFKSVVLSFTVLGLSRLVDSANGVEERKVGFWLLHWLECASGVVMLGVCFCCLSALVGGEVHVDIAQNGGQQLSFVKKLCTHVFVVAPSIYVMTDIVLCTRLLYLKYETKRRAADLAASL